MRSRRVIRKVERISVALGVEVDHCSDVQFLRPCRGYERCAGFGVSDWLVLVVRVTHGARNL